MEISESTETIQRKIINDAEEEAERIKAEAREKTAEILREAEERAEEMKKKELEKIRQHTEETRKQDIAEKKVDYHRRTQNFKSELIDDTFNEVREKLRDYVKKPAYQEILSELIIEAGNTLGGGNLVIKLNESDKKKMSEERMEKISQKITELTNTETEITVDEDTVNTIGGAVVTLSDQKATIDNTFEARLERIQETGKTELETILFK
ncbi:MAG: V-type ATP synthase subunit E [Thermoproteota archaeon]